MSEPDTPAPEKPDTDSSPFSLGEIFSQANITTALAVLAVILAGAPYVMPRVAGLLTQKGLLSRPAMLTDAARQLQADATRDSEKRMTEQIRAHRDSIFNDPADPVLGKGPIKLVEFMDYQCAFCRAGEPALQQFLKDNPDVQLVVKEYPVVHPPVSVQLAQIGLAAYQAGKYANVHDALLTEQLKSDADLDALLSKAGLDPAATRKAASQADATGHVMKTVTLGENLDITGTPTFIIGEHAINGTNIGALQAAVEAERARRQGK